ERFTNFTTADYPLLSDVITAFGHDPDSGKLFIGTPEGLNSMVIGKTINNQKEFLSVKAFPNPYKPDLGQSITIANIDDSGFDIGFPNGVKECYIYDTAGDLVRILKIENQGLFVWDGNNEAGKKCSSGIYFFVTSSEDGFARGKIAIIR
ncbi:MAG: hypothetical protein JXR56_06580, partial [Candidatus Cloacimonetes bacterium]|nr:hypothetical protein [Candidatus Cloacimonadota bacterium]